MNENKWYEQQYQTQYTGTAYRKKDAVPQPWNYGNRFYNPMHSLWIFNMAIITTKSVKFTNPQALLFMIGLIAIDK